jgi:hypothetical protein
MNKCTLLINEGLDNPRPQFPGGTQDQYFNPSWSNQYPSQNNQQYFPQFQNNQQSFPFPQFQTNQQSWQPPFSYPMNYGQHPYAIQGNPWPTQQQYFQPYHNWPVQQQQQMLPLPITRP